MMFKLSINGFGEIFEVPPESDFTTGLPPILDFIIIFVTPVHQFNHCRTFKSIIYR